MSGPDDNSIIVFQWSFSVDWGSIDKNPTVFFNRSNEGFVLFIGELDDGMLIVDSITKGCVNLSGIIAIIFSSFLDDKEEKFGRWR